MKFMSEQRQCGARYRNAALARARTLEERPATSPVFRNRRSAIAGASQPEAFSPQGPRQATTPANRATAPTSFSSRGYSKHRSRRRSFRRGVATLDYALLIGIVLPLAAFVLVIAPRIMLRVYEMVCTMVSWPFM